MRTNRFFFFASLMYAAALGSWYECVRACVSTEWMGVSSLFAYSERECVQVEFNRE